MSETSGGSGAVYQEVSAQAQRLRREYEKTQKARKKAAAAEASGS